MPKALIIDDEIAITSIVGRFLESDDFEVETAASGPEGLGKAFSTRPDIVVVDIMMPDMDGYEVCRRMRTDPRTARASIVALTARSQPIDKEMAFLSGADAHVAKPFKGKDLVEVIRSLLDEKVCAGPPLGYEILILRLKEQAGATMLATNLALSLAAEEGCQTAIADMVLQGGMVGDRLGLPTSEPWSLTSQINPDELASHLVRQESGLFALATPVAPPGGQVAPSAVTRLCQLLGNWHDYVVIDTPVNLGLLASPLLRSSTLILLLLTPEPTVVHQAQTSLAVLLQAGVRPTKIWPILNMMRPEQLPLQQQIEKLWNRPVPAILPWMPKECAQALADRKPIVVGQPESTLATTFRSLAEQIAQAAHLTGRGDNPA